METDNKGNINNTKPITNNIQNITIENTDNTAQEDDEFTVIINKKKIKKQQKHQ